MTGLASPSRRPDVRSQPSLQHEAPCLALSVVIVNWNTRELLARCLTALRREIAPTEADRPTPTSEVLVVDNASADGSAELVRKQFPDVQLLKNQENLGFARANNQALKMSNSRYVLLLNPDTEVMPGALASLVQFMDNHPEAGAAGARLVDEQGGLQPSCYRAPTLRRELLRLAHLDVVFPASGYQMHRWSVDTPRQVDVVQGAALILRRAALDDVGLLDEDYFIYSEEVDLCFRLQQHGWRIFWVPWSVVVHYGGQSTRQVAAAMFLRLYQGKVLYFRKHHGPRAARAYKLILLGAAVARVALTPLALAGRAADRPRYLALATNYRRLLGALPAL